jgi:nicotinic acid mononucleotide adenylyltransferase
MDWRLRITREPARWRQRLFSFRERSQRRDRVFKVAILLLTLAAVFGVFAGTPRGRYAAQSIATQARWAAQSLVGLEPSREEVDAEWRRKRERGIAFTRDLLQQVYDEESPAYRKLLRTVGMDPEHALLRWGNYDRILLLSPMVFAPDEKRSYRLRPNTKSIWLRQITIGKGISGMFLIPDNPETRAALAGVVAFLVEQSAQTTNSWGLRGPEPDLSAPVRGLVLGDSFMQGMFISDEDTPPMCLQRSLSAELNQRVAILNTGHLGYSLEQYYYTMVEYFDRFRPHFVLLSIFANDFGETFDVSNQGKGDWKEGKYWIDEITQFCRTRQVPCFVTVIPLEGQIAGKRNEGNYPGQVSNLYGGSGMDYINPLDAFIDEHVRLMVEGKRRGHRPSTSPLFNGELGDGHFSAKGAELWGRLLARRISLRLQDLQRAPEASPSSPGAEPVPVSVGAAGGEP